MGLLVGPDNVAFDRYRVDEDRPAFVATNGRISNSDIRVGHSPRSEESRNSLFPAGNQTKIVLHCIYYGQDHLNLSWPSSAVIINDASPTADSLAAVNGLSQMVIVLSEAVAPTAATMIFAFSKSSNVLNGNLIWVVLFAISCGTALHCWTLKEATHDWRKDYEDELASEE